MDELLILGDGGIGQILINGCKLLLDKVLNCLNVVVGSLFDFLYATGIIFAEIAVDIAQLVEQSLVERRELWQRQFTKRLPNSRQS